MVRGNTRVIHLHDHVGAGEVQIIRQRHGSRGHTHRGARKIIGRHAPMRRFQQLHAGQLRQRQPVRRRLHADDRAERRAIRRHHDTAEFLNLFRRRRRAAAEQSECQKSSLGQRLLFHRQTEQRRLHLEIRIVGQHRLDERIAFQRRRARRRQLHEQRIVRNVRNCLRAHFCQRRAERPVNHAVRLHDVSARLARCAQVRGNFQIHFRVRLNQRVIQQNGVAI